MPDNLTANNVPKQCKLKYNSLAMKRKTTCYLPAQEVENSEGQTMHTF